MTEQLTTGRDLMQLPPGSIIHNGGPDIGKPRGRVYFRKLDTAPDSPRYGWWAFCNEDGVIAPGLQDYTNVFPSTHIILPAYLHRRGDAEPKPEPKREPSPPTARAKVIYTPHHHITPIERKRYDTIAQCPCGTYLIYTTGISGAWWKPLGPLARLWHRLRGRIK